MLKKERGLYQRGVKRLFTGNIASITVDTVFKVVNVFLILA
jgi:hypothetical protein